nr:MAG TPA: hypothetical protein [Caudoviricetes sp.]
MTVVVCFTVSRASTILHAADNDRRDNVRGSTDRPPHIIVSKRKIRSC